MPGRIRRLLVAAVLAGGAGLVLPAPPAHAAACSSAQVVQAPGVPTACTVRLPKCTAAFCALRLNVLGDAVPTTWILGRHRPGSATFRADVLYVTPARRPGHSQMSCTAPRGASCVWGFQFTVPRGTVGAVACSGSSLASIDPVIRCDLRRL